MNGGRAKQTNAKDARFGTPRSVELELSRALTVDRRTEPGRYMCFHFVYAPFPRLSTALQTWVTGVSFSCGHVYRCVC